MGIGTAFYGLRSCLLVLFLTALLRIKRPEAPKEHVPEGFGAIILFATRKLRRRKPPRSRRV